MEPRVKEKNFFVRGEYLTAGLIGILILTIFGGGIFLFKNISPVPTQSPKPQSADVLSAAATPVPQETVQPPPVNTPVGPQALVSTPKPTKSPTPKPSISPSASPTSSVSPSPSAIADSSPSISLSEPSNDASVSGQLKIKGSASGSDLKSVSLYINEVFQEKKTDSLSSYEFTWDSTKQPNGKYTIKVEAENNGGAKKSSSVDVNTHN